MKEATVIDRDAYWYRLVLPNGSEIFQYSWGTGDMAHVYRARLRYLGRDSYRLTDRTYNGMRYALDTTVTRKQRRRVKAYKVTLALISRLLNG